MMEEFNFRRYGVKNASWGDILAFVFTCGKKGKLFDIVDMSHFPPNHVNCRCSFVATGEGDD